MLASQSVEAVAIWVGASTVIITGLIRIYQAAKRIEGALGVDKHGRTLAQRLDRVEHQLWPNGGSSLADRVNQIQAEQTKSATEIAVVKHLLDTLIARGDK